MCLIRNRRMQVTARLRMEVIVKLPTQVTARRRMQVTARRRMRIVKVRITHRARTILRALTTRSPHTLQLLPEAIPCTTAITEEPLHSMLTAV